MTAARRARLKPPRVATALALLGASALANAGNVIGPAVTASFAPDGSLWRVMPTRDGVVVDHSADRGQTFGASVRVSLKEQRIQAQSEDRPWIAVDERGRIYVVYAADARQPWTRFLVMSVDSGRTFSAPVPLSSAPERMIQYQPALAARPQGGVDLFWIEEDPRQKSGPPGGALHVRRMRDSDVAAAPDLRLHDAMCECCRLAPQATADGSTVVFARLVLNGRTRDLGIVGIGADGAGIPASPVTDDQWEINACPESGPALAIGDGGRYHLSWFTLGQKRQGLFYAWSDDRGTTLSSPLPIGNREALAAHADVAALGKTVLLTWQQYDGRKTAIVAMLSQDNGETWAEPQELAASEKAADYPFALSDGRGLYVSWYAEDAGYRLIPVVNGAG